MYSRPSENIPFYDLLFMTPQVPPGALNIDGPFYCLRKPVSTYAFKYPSILEQQMDDLLIKLGGSSVRDGGITCNRRTFPK